MHWKYTLEKDDLVIFDHNGKRAAGSVMGIRLPQDPDEYESYDDVDFDEIDVRIQSGQENVVVPLSNIVRRERRAADREDEIVPMCEEFRFSGGIEQV